MNREYILIQNNGTGSIFYRTGELSATTSDLEIIAGGVYEPINTPINQINLISGTGTQSVVIIEGEY